ncbi:MAG TPA: MauE/DoxX family redox-associated membrane protein [Candidatus Paceibacterota bacterium]|nr:MauE/DoxX family redox-associated membrane protein [Candidatus Paceibacterota bacterium]
MSASLRDISLDFSTWTPYKVVDPFRMLGTPIDGLKQHCYQIEKDGVLLSAGVFEFKEKKTHVAWGIKSDPHCSFHALALPDGSWGAVIEGCPEYQVLRHERTIAGFSVDGIIVATGAYARSAWQYTKEKLRQFAPLILFFALAILWASVKTYFFADPLTPVDLSQHVHGNTAIDGHLVHEWMLDFMGGFFLLFGGLKALRLRKFAHTFASYDVVARRFKWWGYVYPFVELGLGVLYTIRLFLPLAYLLTVIVMAVGCVGIGLKLYRKERAVCACLGGFFDIPLTEVTLIENFVMANMAFVMLLFAINI